MSKGRESFFTRIIRILPDSRTDGYIGAFGSNPCLARRHALEKQKWCDRQKKAPTNSKFRVITQTVSELS